MLKILAIFFTLVLMKPLAGFAREHVSTDTVPALKKPVTEQPDVKKPLEELPDVKKLDVIKEVPKSRRKMKPIAVPAPIPVKPIRIIKPKIIRKVI
ncbi:hypothetical protein [Chitinophaga niabensis]|uniref:hypothetical protein n=1 Tax=Chitinophaga niabensis TaxID=536979 RepID=UPI0009409600|nr:hypothetical protein [Chitinophaga niabensis]